MNNKTATIICIAVGIYAYVALNIFRKKREYEQFKNDYKEVSG